MHAFQSIAYDAAKIFYVFLILLAFSRAAYQIITLRVSDDFVECIDHSLKHDVLQLQYAMARENVVKFVKALAQLCQIVSAGFKASVLRVCKTGPSVAAQGGRTAFNNISCIDYAVLFIKENSMSAVVPAGPNEFNIIIFAEVKDVMILDANRLKLSIRRQIASLDIQPNPLTIFVKHIIKTIRSAFGF